MWPAMRFDACVRRFERAVAVGRVGEHDGDDLLGRNFKVRRSDALSGMSERNGPAIRRRLQSVVDVVHALQRFGLPRVHLQDDALGLIDPRLVVADRGTRQQPSVFQHSRDLNQRDIQLAQKSILDELGHMAEVNVHVFHLAGIDALAGLRVGLVGKAQVDAARHGERAVQARGRWRRR